MSLTNLFNFKLNWTYCFVVIGLLHSCASIQTAERGHSQQSPGFSYGISKSKTPKVQKNNSYSDVSNLKVVTNSDSSTRNTEIGLSHSSQSRSHCLYKPSESLEHPVSSLNLNNSKTKIKGLKHIPKIEEKRHSVSSKNSVLPDSDSPFLKWVTFMMGVIIVVIGIILLAILIYEGGFLWDDLDILLYLMIAVLFVLGAGAYFLASHGFDDLEEHSIFYQIGFYMSVFSPFLFFLPAIIGLPMLILSAVFENRE